MCSFFWHSVYNNGFILCRLFGDYETLSHGDTADALVDFTGGVAEKIELKKFSVSDTHSQLEVFNKVKEALDNHGLINCNIEVSESWITRRDFAKQTAHPRILNELILSKGESSKNNDNEDDDDAYGTCVLLMTLGRMRMTMVTMPVRRWRRQRRRLTTTVVGVVVVDAIDEDRKWTRHRQQ